MKEMLGLLMVALLAVNGQDIINFNPNNWPKATEAQCIDYCTGPGGRDRGACGPDEDRGGFMQWCNNVPGFPQFYADEDDCMTQCREFLSYTGEHPLDDLFEQPWDSANSVECRTIHLDRVRRLGELAIIHCPHASPGGGGVCVARVIPDPENPGQTIPNPAFTAVTQEIQLADIWRSGNNMPTGLNGMLWLGDQRSKLIQNNLFDPYTPEQRDALRVGITCGPNQEKWRTADGRCNNLCFPEEGMSNTRIGRQLRHDLAHTPTLYDINDPPLAKVAEALPRLKNDGYHPSPLLNLLGAAWLQFMNHDWFDHVLDKTAPCFNITMPDGSIFCLHPTKREMEGEDDWGFNSVTHWWDGSQMYGSTQEQEDRVRTFSGGRLVSETRPDGKEYLARDNEGNVITGFSDNWWIGLEIFHTLFLREHQYIVQELANGDLPRSQFNSDAEHDEALFQTAKLIVSALTAKLHTIDWTPAVLFQEATQFGLNVNWHGLIKTFDLWRNSIGQPNLSSDGLLPGGLPLELFATSGGFDGVGGKPFHVDVPHSVTEEFVSVYRMHHLMPDFVNIDGNIKGIEQLYFEGAWQPMLEQGLSKWILAFGSNRAGNLDVLNYPDSLLHLKMPDGRILNMAEVDIARDRERGVPRYAEFRRGLQNSEGEFIQTFDQITPVVEIQELLYDLYDGDIMKVDLMVGLMAEGYRPAGYGFSATTFSLFLLFASRRLWTDRFYREAGYNAEHYTQWGLDHVENTNLKDLILRHCPDLSEFLDDIPYTDYTKATVFHPWPGVPAQQRPDPHFSKQCGAFGGPCGAATRPTCPDPNPNPNPNPNPTPTEPTCPECKPCRPQPGMVEWNVNFNTYKECGGDGCPHKNMEGERKSNAESKGESKQ